MNRIVFLFSLTLQLIRFHPINHCLTLIIEGLIRIWFLHSGDYGAVLRHSLGLICFSHFRRVVKIRRWQLTLHIIEIHNWVGRTDDGLLVLRLVINYYLGQKLGSPYHRINRLSIFITAIFACFCFLYFVYVAHIGAGNQHQALIINIDIAFLTWYALTNQIIPGCLRGWEL